MFIQASTNNNSNIGITAIIERFTHHSGCFTQITAVDSDCIDDLTVYCEFVGKVDDLFCGGTDIVGIHQQGDITGLRAGEVSKCGRFVVMRLNKRMSHGARGRDPETHTSHDGGGTIQPGKITCPRGKNARFGSMGAAQPKIDNTSSICR